MPAVAPSIDPCPSVTELMVQWGDMDALGHVNNTVFFRWFESSRICYLEESGMSKVLGELNVGPILAATDCNYVRQVLYPDTVRVGTMVKRLGRSSSTLTHIVHSDRLGTTVAYGESVVVVFDFASQRPVRIPQEVRDLLVSFQPGFDPAA